MALTLLAFSACANDSVGGAADHPASAMTEPLARLAAPAHGTVQVDCPVGRFTFVGSAGAEIRLDGEVPDGIELMTARHGHLSTVRCHQRSEPGAVTQATRLEVTLPKASRLEVETVTGDVTIEGVVGDITVTTVTGAVRLLGAAQSATVSTTSGPVDASLDAPRLTVRTVDGTIESHGAVDTLDLSTAAASIRVTGIIGEVGTLASATGSISLETPPAAGARIEIDGPATPKLKAPGTAGMF